MLKFEREMMTDTHMFDDSIFRCRRCRHVLFSGENVLTEHGFHMFKCDGDSSTSDEICAKSTLARQSQWFISIDENFSPGWIQKSLEAENWLKGKLNCPKCKGRVGSFDFITPSKCPCGQFTQPAVHVLCSRVDHSKARTSEVLPGLVVPSLDKVPDQSRCCDRTSEIHMIQENLGSHSSVENHHGNRTSISENLNFVISKDGNVHEVNKYLETDTGYYHGNRVVSPELASMTTTTVRDRGSTAEELVGNLRTLNDVPAGDKENRLNCHRDTHRSYLPLSENEPIRSFAEDPSLSRSPRGDLTENPEELRSLGLENKRRSKHRKRIGQKSHDQEDFGNSGSHKTLNRFQVLETAGSNVQENGTNTGNMQRKPIIVDEREELPVSDEFLCPVCLDLYCKPLLCYPCQHTFCEPCLRRLARAKPINTVCPLCRKIITECHKNNELEVTLKELYRYNYTERNRSERKFCSDRFYPLPRGRLLEEIPEQDRMGQVSRKTWITVLLVVMGISIVCFRPVVVNFVSVVDAIVTVISIMDLVNLF